MSKETLSSNGKVAENNVLQSEPVVMVSNDSLSAAECLMPHIIDAAQNLSIPNNIADLRKSMASALKAHKLLEVAMQQIMEQLREHELKQLPNNEEQRQANNDHDDDDGKNYCAHLRHHIRHRSRGHSRGHSRCNSRGRSLHHASSSSDSEAINGHKHCHRMMMMQHHPKGMRKHFGKHYHKHGKHLMGMRG